MKTREIVVLTLEQLRNVLQTGYDISLNELTIYDLRAEVSYRLLDEDNELINTEFVTLDSDQVLVTDIDDDVSAQVTAEAIRLLIDRVTSNTRAAKVEITVDTALEPDFQTTDLDEEVTAEALKRELTKRDLQDVKVLRTGQLPRGSIGTDAIQDGAVAANKLASGSVDENKLAPNSVGALHIKDNAISAAKLDNASVGNSQLADNSVSGAKVRDGSITLDKLASDARSATGVQPVVQSGVVTGDKLSSGSVGTDQLADNSVTSSKLASASVQSDAIATGAIDGSKVAARSLSLDHFIDGPAGVIADNSVGGEALQAGSISRDKLATGLLVEPNISGEETLSGMDVPLAAGGVRVGQPVGMFINSSGNAQAVALTTAALTAAHGTLPLGATPAQYFYGIVRSVAGGVARVATMPNAMVRGFTNLRGGAFYKPNAAGDGFERTTVANDAKAVAADANTLRVLASISV